MTITGNDVVASLQLCMQVVSRDSKALAGVQAETRHGEQQMEADGQYKFRSCWYKSSPTVPGL